MSKGILSILADVGELAVKELPSILIGGAIASIIFGDDEDDKKENGEDE